VDKLTNKHTDKQTPLKTSTALRYATPMYNDKTSNADRRFFSSTNYISRES